MRIYKNRFALSAVLVLASFAAEARSAAVSVQSVADTVGVKVYYRSGSNTIYPEYKGNGKRLNDFIVRLRGLKSDPGIKFKNIQVISSASPAGLLLDNMSIASTRGTNTANYIFSRVKIPDVSVAYESIGEDWGGLTDLVKRSEMPFKEEALIIIRNRSGIERKGFLRDLRGGSVWRYMNDNFFPELAYVDVNVIFEIETEIPEVEVEIPAPVEPDTIIVAEQNPVHIEPEPLPEPGPGSEPEPEQVVVPVEPEPSGRRFVMAVKTNMLYDAALVPNIGVECDLGGGWSVGASIQNAWWSRNVSHRYWRIQGGELEVRKYFGTVASERTFSGHHMGLYIQAVNYDFEFGGRGYMGGLPGKNIFDRCSYGVGFEYGYSMPVSNCLNINFGIGVGYLGGEYRKYDPINTHYVYLSKHRLNWFGPTKAEISLVWIFGNGSGKQNGGTK